MSSVHARNVFEVFLRLAGFGIDALSVSQALNLVVNQRLLPRLCDACKVIDLQSSNRMGYDVYKPAGCMKCDYSGCSGRVLAVESLSIDAAVSAAVLSGRLDRQTLQSCCSIENYSSINQTMEKMLYEGKIGFSQIEQITGVR